MTNSKELFKELLNKIELADREEAVATLYHLLDAKCGITRADIMAGKIAKEEFSFFEKDILRINQHEPIQYITQTAWFRNRKFKVTDAVLIPRPETEELVALVVREQKSKPVILDVGTGSGCIAISLALEIEDAKVMAIDVSEEALLVAEENARLLHASVKIVQADFLNDTTLPSELDLLVSNPPYVMQKEKETMHQNVLNFEPHVALFVPDQDPLLFYRALAEKGRKILKEEGKVLAEINPLLATETKSLFESLDYRNVMLIKDLEGKDRFVIATR
jgi:release factor glutamine methyltransferase